MAPPRPQANGDVHENGQLELPPRHENGDFVRHENGNGAVPSFHGNGDAAHENGDDADENGDDSDDNGVDPPQVWYVRQVYENSDAGLPAENEDRYVALQPGENELFWVMDYALQEWHPEHMVEECETDAVFEEDFFRYPLGSRCPPTPVPDDFIPTWPLHFQSVTKINGRRYLMQLEKVPFEYTMHKLLVRSLPFSDWGIVTDDYLEQHKNHENHANGGMDLIYHLLKIVSVDRQFLVRLEITRVYSLHRI